MSHLYRIPDAPKPRKQVLVMKRQITKAEDVKLGGETNPKLFRVVKNGKWTYWRTE